MRLAAAALLLAALHCGHSSDPDCSAVRCTLAPAVTINVRDSRGTVLSAAVMVSNLVVPSSAAGATASCTAQNSTLTSCSINAHAAGHYELDLAASGYAVQHVGADVPAPIAPPTGCCALSYVPVQIDATITPSP